MALKIKGLWAGDFDRPDGYLAFRGRFTLSEDKTITLKVLSSGWHRLWLEDEMITQGPPRFNLDFPEYEPIELDLQKGDYVLSSLVHNTAVSTRLLEAMEPFWFCECGQVDIEWKCLPLDAYDPQVRRINPQLDWIEWCDTRKIPVNWQRKDFDDSQWLSPTEVVPKIGEASELCSRRCQTIYHRLEPIADGQLAEFFSYEKDDPPTRFFLRDLECIERPAQGIWLRYDLGRVRLSSPDFLIEVPEGAVVEFAFAEYLSSGRVAPYINCSAGMSANMDHYIGRGGIQQFAPITPKGGRFLEVHILADPAKIKVHKSAVIERAYYARPQGSFSCSDELLERIWHTGIETFRACAEDALTDNPTRERGQWTGDVVSVGMEIAAAGFADLSIFKRALKQAAQSKNKDGLIAGMSPGASIYVSSFAAQWVNACLRYYQITGDMQMLRDNYKPACDNLRVFENALTDKGLSRDIEWAFIDWGYFPSPGEPDIAMDCHYLNALHAAIEWARLTDDDVNARRFAELSNTLTVIIERNVLKSLEKGWPHLGYHSAVLAGYLGFFSGTQLSECLEFVKSHILNCFPENDSAVRLSSPTLNTTEVITPYFSHFALDFLARNDEFDFVLERYRNCWGWALGRGLTTWPEVFDLRWSHCHQWSGCPTWQLSRYCLGLEHRNDKGQNHFDFTFKECSLDSASGKLPLNEHQIIDIEWKRHRGRIEYNLKSDEPLTIHGLPNIGIKKCNELSIVI
jgi:hypothetical protein